MHTHTHCAYITDCFNSSILNCNFPEELKLANVVPVLKKDDPLNKKNYRPISLLPIFSKVFEKILFEQITSFFNDKFSTLLCGFRKGFSTQHSLFNLILKWQKCLDNKGIIGTILMDLSKAYDCIPYDLLLAKLSAYGFSLQSLRFMETYLKSRKQRIKLGSIFSKWLNVIIGIPQGSILGPLLFNIFLNDIFLFIVDTDICNFADDNTIYACGMSFERVLNRLSNDIKRLENWFKINSMVANPDKFQVMFLGTHPFPDKISLFGNDIIVQNKVKLLGITIDKQLNFSSHIQDLCKNANTKISCLFRLRNNLDIIQTRTLINSYVLSYFLYCPLIWMFCKKKEYSLIEKVHKRSLRLLHLDFSLSYSELLSLENTKSIHHKHLVFLLVETYKSINKLNPEIMWDSFKIKEVTYSLRNSSLLKLPNTNTSIFGLNSLMFRASILWNSIPDFIKKSSSVSKFCSLLKNWDGINCSCKICRI